MAKPKVQFTDEVKEIEPEVQSTDEVEEIQPTASTASVLETTVLVYHDVRLLDDDGKIL